MKSSELLRILFQDGWEVQSRKGSHVKLKHPFKEGVLIVPDHGSKEVATGTASKILKSAGLK
jgi:predicted RNA binding protein YcfA (HicA-like mRNA interferase family)